MAAIVASYEAVRREAAVPAQGVTESTLADGTKRARCYIEKTASGLWFFFSDDWRGMLLTHRDLGTILAEVPVVGKLLLKAMKEHHAKTPYTDEKQLRQMQIYEDFFGEGPPLPSTERE